MSYLKLEYLSNKELLGSCFKVFGAGGAGRLATKDRFRGIALAFGTNLLKRSFSVIGSNTRGSNTGSDTADIVALVRDVRGANLI